LKNLRNDDILDELDLIDPTEEFPIQLLSDDELLDAGFENNDGEEPEELERRRIAYAELKKNDKIFNNSYNMGLTTGDDVEEPRAHSEIRLDASSPDYHLYNRDRHSDYIDNTIIQKDIHSFVSRSDIVTQILGDCPDKKKFTKAEINQLFDVIRNGVTNGDASSVFISSIHVLAWNIKNYSIC
jgi:hypothetical protein